MKKYFSYLLLPAALVYYELTLRVSSGMGISHPGLPGALLACLALAFFLCCFCRGFWSCLIAAELGAVWFLIAYFSNDTYYTFMSPGIIFGTAGNVVNEFSDTLKVIFTSGLPMILLYHIPVILMLIFRKRISFPKGHFISTLAVFLLIGAGCLAGSLAVSSSSELLRSKMTNEYSYDGAVRSFGLINALFLDGYNNSSLGAAESAGSISLQAEAEASAAPAEASAVDYGQNIMEIDFDALLSDPSRDEDFKTIDLYVQSRQATAKNEYTGIFKGKNLILICAESFSKELIDQERTPALYRLANKGIVFEDYYQPFWGGSTTTGEYSFLTGLIPTVNNATEQTVGHNCNFTIGNQLRFLGYTSYGFHNGDLYYYSRNKTHQNLGYDSFIAFGNGMEYGVTEQWPASDLEMFNATIPRYIEKQPFSVYYMTISGHCNYTYTSNSMSRKNMAFGQSFDVPEQIGAYYAANQELEYALEALLAQLEEYGILNDTVIALTTDHYPYGLRKSTAWENSTDYLEYLYGYSPEGNAARDHNAAVIWCGSLEEEEAITVSEPSCSLDLLPTLLNLFGIDYDSRLLVGHDLLSGEEGLVVWNDRSWLTELGYYEGETHEFTPAEGAEIPEGYVDSICAKVNNYMIYSDFVLKKDYFASLPQFAA